jgi:lipid-A-disaccharide synthase
VPVMYYISPQVWAWRTYRVRTLARLVDRLAVIFPFEADFYRERGVPVTYVGHPFMETLPPAPDRRQWLAGRGLDPERLTVALLPGSRRGEVERHLPALLAGAGLLNQALPACQFVLPLAAAELQEVVAEIAGQVWEGPPPSGPLLKIIPGESYEALAAAHLAMVASGTATVEAALAGTPSIIVYRLSPLTFTLGKWLIRVPHVGMANLLAGEGIFPELLQADFSAVRLAQEALALLGAPARLAAVRRGLIRVVSRLGGPGASKRAAQVALELMAENSPAK